MNVKEMSDQALTEAIRGEVKVHIFNCKKARSSGFLAEPMNKIVSDWSMADLMKIVDGVYFREKLRRAENEETESEAKRKHNEAYDEVIAELKQEIVRLKEGQ